MLNNQFSTPIDATCAIGKNIIDRLLVNGAGLVNGVSKQLDLVWWQAEVVMEIDQQVELFATEITRDDMGDTLCEVFPLVSVLIALGYAPLDQYG